MTDARYDWEDNGRLLMIVDENDGAKSVTNDIEAVILAFGKRGIDVDQRRIIYQDSSGIWDGVATRDGQFAGFIPLGKASITEAVAAAWKHEPWAPGMGDAKGKPAK